MWVPPYCGWDPCAPGPLCLESRGSRLCHPHPHATRQDHFQVRSLHRSRLGPRITAVIRCRCRESMGRRRTVPGAQRPAGHHDRAGVSLLLVGEQSSRVREGQAKRGPEAELGPEWCHPCTRSVGAGGGGAGAMFQGPGVGSGRGSHFGNQGAASYCTHKPFLRLGRKLWQGNPGPGPQGLPHIGVATEPEASKGRTGAHNGLPEAPPRQSC